jgi:hypothetical protein
MAGSWGTPAPKPLQNSDYYSMVSVFHQMSSDNYPLTLPFQNPSIPYSNLGQLEAEPYYAGYHPGTEQLPARGPTMSFSPHLAEAAQNQDPPSEWRFHTCWVSHAEEDKIHLTIALKKS